MSKQAEWQAKKLAAGLCRTCGKRPAVRKECAVCRARERRKQRKKLGFKAWRAGKRGRPPLQ